MLEQDGARRVIFPGFKIHSEQARNLLKRLVETKAYDEGREEQNDVRKHTLVIAD